MGRAIERREFLKKGLKAGLTAAMSGPLLSDLAHTPFTALAEDGPDVAVGWGDDHGKNALKAVELLGGIGRFVPKDSRLAILANVQSSHPGTFTSPAVLRAAIQLCRQAVAKEINLADATEFITTNGPFGPGELIRPKKVVAGTDRVAIDAYCAALWGLKGEDIVMIRRGKDHGLGQYDLKKIKIKEMHI